MLYPQRCSHDPSCLLSPTKVIYMAKQMFGSNYHGRNVCLSEEEYCKNVGKYFRGVLGMERTPG